ncbi:MAG: hypothetical protein IT365_24045 [Candidatus Hydrogenedentes bacterium]|nr:hypothetical protein [Candidatus Hydrogenedentota bacterium]
MISEEELIQEFIKGRRLPREDGPDLYKALLAEPDNVLLRVRLLGYIEAHPLKRSSLKATGARVENIIWFITNMPHHRLLSHTGIEYSVDAPDDVYERIAKCWMDAMASHPGDVQVVFNAVAFFEFHQPRTSLKLLLASLPAAPGDTDHLYLMHRIYRRIEHREGGCAFRATDRILPKLDKRSGPNAWAKYGIFLAELAMKCGEFEDAKKHLENFLQNTRPNEIYDLDFERHRAHTLLGLVALKEGDVQRASEELRASAEVPDSPALTETGPSMRLAQDLTRAGEKDVVVEFLGLWKDRWVGPRSVFLEQWEDEIQLGQEPDFGPNVSY